MSGNTQEKHFDKDLHNTWLQYEDKQRKFLKADFVSQLLYEDQDHKLEDGDQELILYRKSANFKQICDLIEL